MIENEFIDFGALDTYLIRACNHYEKTAPQVERYLTDLLVRFAEDTEKITVHEILTVSLLYDDGEWMPPTGATNFCLHIMNAAGLDTSEIMI